MSEWFAAPVALELRDEVNKAYPHRDKSSDGLLGDASHQARKSEHNPCWTCSGRFHGAVVAIDIDIDDGDPGRDLRRELLRELIGDPRVWYVISNGIIYSRTHGWVPRRYTGSNGHFHHVHVSFLMARIFDTKVPFLGPAKPVHTTPRSLDLAKARVEFIAAIDGRRVHTSVDVRRVQHLINARLGAGTVKADGIVGTATLNAWGRLEEKLGGTGRPRVPDEKSITAANRGMFRLIA